MTTTLVRGLAVGALSSLTREGILSSSHDANAGVVEFIAYGSSVALQSFFLDSSLSANIGNILGSYAGTLLAVYVAHQIFLQTDSRETRIPLTSTSSNEGSTPESRRAHRVNRMYFENGMTGLIASCTISAYKISKGSFIAAIAGGVGAYHGIVNYLAPKGRNRRA